MRTLRNVTPSQPLTLIASPLASSTARSSIVKFFLLVTRMPSPPVPCPCWLKASIGLVVALAANRDVVDVERQREVNSNLPSPNSIVSPGLALIRAV